VALPPIKPTLALRVAGSVLTGSMTLQGNTVPIHDGHIDGNRASWKVDVDGHTMAFKGTITNGRRMSGTVTTDWGATYNFTGKKVARIRRFFGLARSQHTSQPSPLN
jgi:hypothetical protein